MNTKDLKEWFRNIKKYKTLIQNYNDTIAYYKDCLNSDEKCIELVKVQEERLPVQTSRKYISPQEIEHTLKTVGIKRAKEEIRKYTDKRNSIYRKMYLMDKAFEYLEEINKEASFIIECSLVNRMSWKEIDLNFNMKFRNEKTIGENRMRHLLGEGLIDMIEYIDSIPANKINYSHIFKKEILSICITYDNK